MPLPKKRVKPISRPNPTTYKFDIGEDEVLVGGDRADLFEPKVRFKGLSNARKPSDLEIELSGLDISLITHFQRGERAGFQNSKISYEVYGLEPSDISGVNVQGGLELELILKSRPPTNIFQWRVRGADHLNFFYQPSMIEEKGEFEVVSKTETSHLDVSGNIIAYRPENIVGSYAVYYKNPSDSMDKTVPQNIRQVGGGKAFHILRPKITDNNGNEIWGTLSYNDGIFSIEIDNRWLNTAKYPVIIDPTFGKTDIGASSAGYGILDNGLQLGWYGSAAPAQNYTDIFIYGYHDNTPQGGRGVIYDRDAGEPDNRLAVGPKKADTWGSSGEWTQLSITYSLSVSQDIYLGAAYSNDGGGALFLSYDTVTAGTAHHRAKNINDPPDYYDDPPDPMDPTGANNDDRNISVYAKYTINDSSLEVSGGTYNIGILESDVTFSTFFSNTFLSFTKFQNAITNIAKGIHANSINANSNTFKVYLSNDAPNPSTHSQKSDVTELPLVSGYTGPIDIENVSVTSNGIIDIDASDKIVTANGGSVGPFQSIVLYDEDTVNDQLIGWWTYHNGMTLEDGQSYKIDFSGGQLFSVF